MGVWQVLLMGFHLFFVLFFVCFKHIVTSVSAIEQINSKGATTGNVRDIKTTIDCINLICVCVSPTY